MAMAPAQVRAYQVGPPMQWDRFSHVINGHLVDGEYQFNGTNPATKELLSRVPLALEGDVDAAACAAKQAFEVWCTSDLSGRQEYLKKLRDVIQAHEEELIDVYSTETGKATDSAQLDVKAIKGFITRHLNPELNKVWKTNSTANRVTPVGVVVVICPWSSPLTVALRNAIPALLAGNTVILKPSYHTPYTTLKIVEIAQYVLPPGVLQALAGGQATGAKLTAHPNVSMVSFTGSKNTAKRVMTVCMFHSKKVEVSTGGNKAVIVLPDAKIAGAAMQLVHNAMHNSGQSLSAVKKIFIHEAIYHEMVKEMVLAVEMIKTGATPFKTALGHIQNPMHCLKIQDLYADCYNNEYKFATGLPPTVAVNGNYIFPAIVDNPPTNSRIMQEMVIGPICVTQPWSDDEDVVTRADAVAKDTGLIIWGKDEARADAIANRSQSTSAWVNLADELPGRALEVFPDLGQNEDVKEIQKYCKCSTVHKFVQP